MPRKAQQLVEPIDTTMDTLTAAVFSGQRTVHAPPLTLPPSLKPNTRLKDGWPRFPVLVTGQHDTGRLS